MIWASAVSGAFLALFSAIASTMVFSAPIWISALVYLSTSVLYTILIMGALLLLSNRKTEQQNTETFDPGQCAEMQTAPVRVFVREKRTLEKHS